MSNIKDFEKFLSESIQDKSKVNVVFVKHQGMTDYYDEETKAFLNKDDAESHFVQLINSKFDQEFESYKEALDFYKEGKDISGYDIELLTIPFMS